MVKSCVRPARPASARAITSASIASGTRRRANGMLTRMVSLPAEFIAMVRSIHITCPSCQNHASPAPGLNNRRGSVPTVSRIRRCLHHREQPALAANGKIVQPCHVGVEDIVTAVDDRGGDKTAAACAHSIPGTLPRRDQNARGAKRNAAPATTWFYRWVCSVSRKEGPHVAEGRRGDGRMLPGVGLTWRTGSW